MSSAALSGATEAELRAALDAALELAGAADREAARQNAQMEQAEAQAKAHQQARERVETHAKAMQAACRRASVDNKHLEEETKKLSEECAARRLELHQKMESAIGDVKKSAEAAASERASSQRDAQRLCRVSTGAGSGRSMRASRRGAVTWPLQHTSLAPYCGLVFNITEGGDPVSHCHLRPTVSQS